MKPVNIQQYIGRRPIASFGNSDGDLQMMQKNKDYQGRDSLHVNFFADYGWLDTPW